MNSALGVTTFFIYVVNSATFVVMSNIKSDPFGK